MRKANKIMIMTVSVLLTLVLFTSTALSGTLAKYVSSDSMSATARVAKWGVNIDIWVDTAKLKTVCPDKVSKVTLDTSGTNASVEIKGLKMGPSSDLSDVVKVTFSGNPEVKLRIKVIFSISYTNSYASITIPNGVGGVTTTKTYAFPVGFTFAASKCSKVGETYTNVIPSGYVSEPWYAYAGSTSAGSTRIGMNKTEERVIMTTAEKLTDVEFVKTKSGVVDNAYLYKEFAPNTEDGIMFYDTEGNAVDTFEFGVSWPLTYKYSDAYTASGAKTFTEAQRDEIDTWFAKNTTGGLFSVKYTFIIEQITE